jgi:uncharacterized protein YjbI with pentapeptide repeats
LTNLVRADFKQLRRSPPPLTRLENLLTILLAWWLVPLTLLALWARYLPAHYWLGTTWLVTLIGATALFGRHSYRLAGATLRGETPAAAAEGDDGRGIPGRAWREFQQIRPDPLMLGLTAAVALCSLIPFHVNPRGDYTWLLPTLLNTVGIRTFADLREVEMAIRPDGWDGKDWDKVKRVDLRDRNIAFADATRAFLANADLRGANLTGVDLFKAELKGADLRGANLTDADLTWAELQGADLYDAQLQGANLGGAQLQGASLWQARLQGADLGGAHLQGANLLSAELQGADLSQAELQGADLPFAQLQGTDLTQAELQGADLSTTALWRASVGGALWEFGDLRGANVQPMSDSEINTLVTEATKNIPDEERRNATAERLNAGLRTAERPPRPDFPEEWRSEPNVMFEPSDPEPKSFDWGRSQWTGELAYDNDLAKFLGDLACDHDVPEAQTRGLARRASLNKDRLFAHRLAARLIAADCPPAKALPDYIRRGLEELAARPDPSTKAPEASPQSLK